MKVEDGGATFSFIVHDQTLTLDELDILQSLDGWKGFSQVIMHSQYIPTK